MSEENKTFRMLYVIGIVMVVTSHCSGGGISLCTDWFPENSFHMQLFFFASGYFYLKKNEECLGSYIKKKFFKLILPLWIYNIIYGVFTTILKEAGFVIGTSFSLRSVFISSFLFGSDFKFNSPDWFIAQLFIVEVLNVLISKGYSVKMKYREFAIILTELVLGILATMLFTGIDSPIMLILLGRTLYSLSWYGIGRLYKVFEKYDSVDNWKYFSLVLCAQFIILLLINGKSNLSYMSVVSFNFDEKSVLSIYIIPLVAIAFWLRVCKLISPYVLKNRVIQYMGKHTFSIVENQYLGFWFLNTIYYQLSILTNNIWQFDAQSYKSMHNYIFNLPNYEQLKILYVILGLSVPLIMSYTGENIKKILRKNFVSRGK